jgi:transcriptional regulator of acetoin/glycerol metabolism
LRHDGAAAYDWPDNVRQLESVLYYALVMAAAQGGNVLWWSTCRRTSGGAQSTSGGCAPPDEAALRRALEANVWSTSKVAGVPGMNRKTVQRKKKQYGIRREEDA